MDQDATWYGGKRRLKRRCVSWGGSSPQKRHRPQFSVYVYCGQVVRWMNTPLGTEVYLGPGHTVLDGVPALREMATAAPLISAMSIVARLPISATAELL